MCISSRFTLLRPVLLASLAFAGCVRFIPSRGDVVSSYGGRDPAIERVGIEAFEKDADVQDARLKTLIEKRVKAANEGEGQRYRIGPGDMLDVKVEKFDEISGPVEVEPSGEMTLPQIGALSVAGQTKEEVIETIAAQIADYLVDPQVEVTITRPRGKRVWLMGSVTKPGSYPLEQPNYSLIDFLADTGNVRSISTDMIYLFPVSPSAPRAKEKSSNGACASKGIFSLTSDLVQIAFGPRKTLTLMEEVIERHSKCQTPDRSKDVSPAPSSNGNQEISPAAPRIAIDLEKLFGGPDKPPMYVPLLSGDKLFVPPALSVQVHGEVNKRGDVALPGKGRLLSAILAAGGLTYAADIENVEIFRETGEGKKIVLSVNLEKSIIRHAKDVRLYEGDIIWVPSSEGRFDRQNIINWVNSLIGTGSRIQDQVSTGGNSSNTGSGQ